MHRIIDIVKGRWYRLLMAESQMKDVDFEDFRRCTSYFVEAGGGGVREFACRFFGINLPVLRSEPKRSAMAII